MKLGRLAKFYLNAEMSKRDHDFMLENFDVITTFPIYGQFGAM